MEENIAEIQKGAPAWLYSALFVLCLLAPLLFLRVGAAHDEADVYSGKKHGNVLSVLPQLKENGCTDDSVAQSIYSYIELKNPLFMLWPDAKFGYAELLPQENARHFDVKWAQLIAPTTSTSQPLRDIVFPDDVSKAMNGALVPHPLLISSVKIDEVIPIPVQKGVFWMNENGQILKNAPSGATLENALTSLKSTDVPRLTKLQLVPKRGADSTVRIIVRETSGFSALDAAAISELRSYIVQNNIEINSDIIFCVLWKK